MAFKSKEERNAYERNRRATNPEAARKAREASKRSDIKHRAKRVAHHRFIRESDRDTSRHQFFKAEIGRYGKTVEWYRDKLIEQLGLCALCQHLNHSRRGKALVGVEEGLQHLNRLGVDHDHNCCDERAKSCGKCVRGLLCETCNLRLNDLEAVLKEGTVVPKEGTWTSLALQYLTQYATERCGGTR